MKFAHFSHVWGKPGMTPHERYEQLWRELELCDSLGFDYCFCVEHHFRPDESWMSTPSIFITGAGARTANMRIGAMGYIVPLYHPLRLVEEIAVADQVVGGRLEVGLVPGINASYFEPFKIDFEQRKPVTFEFVDFMKAAFGAQPFSFAGDSMSVEDVTLAVLPAQQPHPPVWMQSRDPQTLDLCVREGFNTGYFIIFPRADAAPRYRKYVEDWYKAGWTRKPEIAYSTPVYVDETDEKALETALKRASRAYEGFLPPPRPGDTFESRVAAHAKKFIGRGEAGAAEIMANLFNPDYLLENDLVFVGSPDTVTAKLKRAAEDGVFNVFLGEFNFSDLPEDDLMRSIRLFGEEILPALKDFEPF